MRFCLLLFICTFTFFSNLSAQSVRQITIGQLQSWYRADGSEPEIGRTGLVPDQQDGLRWPAQYKWQDTQAAKALWIGTKNYTDAEQYGEAFFPYKVVHVGPRVSDPSSEFMPVEFKMVGKKEIPVVVVNSHPASQLNLTDGLDEIDPELYCDRKIYNVVNTSIGLTMTRTISAWSQQNHDNYFIYDYVFTNSGNVDTDQDIEQNVVLQDVYFFFQYRYAPTREACSYGYHWLPQSCTWGHSTMLDARGEIPAAGDPFQAIFAWLGKHSQWQGPGDNIGAPNHSGDGRLGAAQYVGVVKIHADKSTTDKNDDEYQPMTTQYIGSDDPITSANDQFNALKMEEEYLAMSAGHPEVRHADAVGDGFANFFGGTSGGYSHVQGFGPYTINPGESIHIVLAEAVAGLSKEMMFEVGANWLNNNTPFQMPDGTTSEDRDAYKNAWVYTGQDSLFNTFDKAIANFQSGFVIPEPPPQPGTFEVYSSNDHLKLYWADNAEQTPNFAGYAVYRAVGSNDTLFEHIFNCGLNTDHPEIVNQYDDYDVLQGSDYYYYIISFDDGSTNNSIPLKSSMFWTRTSEPAFLVDEPQIDADLYVSPTGSDENSGLTAEDPLRSITAAINKILSNRLRPHTIFLDSGIYSNSTTGEIFPINLREYVSLSGKGPDSTIIDGENIYTLLYVTGDSVRINHLSLKNGYTPNPERSSGLTVSSATCSLDDVHIVNNISFDGGGLYLKSSSVALSRVTLTGNSAQGKGGGIFIDNESTLIFDSTDLSSIYNNSADEIGYDIYGETGIDNQNLVVDTFTVVSPSDYYLFPSGKFSWEINQSILSQVEADLYVAPDGDDTNTGLSPEDALKTLGKAIRYISADSLHQRSIYLQNGIYSSEVNGEVFPIYPRSFVSIIGESERETILDANNNTQVFKTYFQPEIKISNITIREGTESSYLEHGGGIYSIESRLELKDIYIKNNSDAGIYLDDHSICTLSGVDIFNNTDRGLELHNNSIVVFDTLKLSNIHSNGLFAGTGKDIYASNLDQIIHVVLDTFTVLYPIETYASPLDRFTFEIQNSIIYQVNADLYVAENGDDQNSGLTKDQPLKTISLALEQIFADHQRPHSIFIANGVYSPSHTGEILPINGKDFVSIVGESKESTIIDGENQYQVFEIIEKENPVIKNLSIQNGYSTEGGGLYCRDAKLQISKVVFKNDSASFGGAVYLDENSTVTISHTIFQNNVAVNYGGGLYINSSNPHISNTLFINNFAHISGGAIALTQSNPEMINLTINGNGTASQYAGVMYSEGESNPVIVNSIIWDNGDIMPILSNYGSLTMAYNDMQNGQDNIHISNGILNWLDGNIDDDPFFIGGDPFDYNLNDGSPCVDAGTAFLVWNGDTLLNVHDSLYRSYAPDMGALESDHVASIVREPNKLPIVYELYQNFPNPFNPFTTIKYSLPKRSHVSLEIFDILGRRVITLVNQLQDPGYKSVVWDSKNSHGQLVSSGIYVYSLKTPDFKSVKKMTLLK